jgi:Domain of unknown function (DUF4270)
MKFISYLKTFIFCSLVLLLVSCDKDYNQIGADIVGDNHYSLTADKYPVIAYNQNIGAVQTNNLPTNLLGNYINPAFGYTNASFVTQLELATVNPTFNNKFIALSDIDSVYLHIPYFVTQGSTDSNTGDTAYTFNANTIYQNTSPNDKINLSVYRCGFPIGIPGQFNVDGLPKYYNNQELELQNLIYNSESKLNNSDEHWQNDQFEFRKTQIKIFKPTPSTEISTRLVPGLYMDLNKDYFLNKIIHAPTESLFNNTVFKDYFKGLYFKTENAGTNGSLAMLDFSKGKIIIVYKDHISASNTEKEKKRITLNLKGYTANFVTSGFTNPVTPNTTSGDSQLYLKAGANSSMGVINLFGGIKNGDSPELNNIRAKNWKVNNASLTFTIDNTTLGTDAPEPNRLYLYDLTHNKPLLDYYYDSSTSSTDVKLNKSLFGGIIQKDATTSRGTKYKINITNHIRHLISSDTVINVKLGLVITENINTISNAFLRNPFTLNGLLEPTKYTPVMNVVNPLGTVLWGSNVSVEEAKRLKLEIYFTKPD